MAGELPTNARDRRAAAADRRPARDGGRRPPPRAGLPPRRRAHPRDPGVRGADGDGGTRHRPARHRRHPPVEDRRAVRDRRHRRPRRSCASAIPEGLAAIARLDGIGPKRADGALGASSACATSTTWPRPSPRAASTASRGSGPATRRPDRRAARRAAAERGDAPERVPLGRALPVAEEVAAALRAAVPGSRVEIAGSLRRGRESAHDIDLVGAADAAGGPPGRPRRPARGGARAGARRGARGRGRPTPGVRAGAGRGAAGVVRQPAPARHRLGGAQRPPARAGRAPRPVGVPARHHRRRRAPSTARRRGGGLRRPRAAPDPAGAARGRGRDRGRARPVRCPSWSRGPTCAGELHAHTTWSDGTESVAAMVEAARARGYRYLAISDHSQSLAMAGGLDRERVRRQWEEIAEAGRPPRRHHRAAGDRGRHPRRRAHRLRRRAAGRLRLGHGEHALRPHPGRRAHHRPGGGGGREPLRGHHRPPDRPHAGPPRAPRPIDIDRLAAAAAAHRHATWRSTASRGASTWTRPWRGAPWPAGARLTVGADAHSGRGPRPASASAVLVARRAGARARGRRQHAGLAGARRAAAPRACARPGSRRRTTGEGAGAAPRARPAGPATSTSAASRTAGDTSPLATAMPRVASSSPSARIARRARQASASVRSSPM